MLHHEQIRPRLGRPTRETCLNKHDMQVRTMDGVGVLKFYTVFTVLCTPTSNPEEDIGIT